MIEGFEKTKIAGSIAAGAPTKLTTLLNLVAH